MFNAISKDVCPCSLCEHSDICKYKESFIVYYNKMNSEDNMSSTPECATMTISCKYVRHSSSVAIRNSVPL